MSLRSNLLRLIVGALIAPFVSPAQAEITPGEILISEMNCVACHRSAPALEARLSSRQAPKLGAEGLTLTPQWLQEFLTDPQKSKPGTLMPDLLHGRSPEEKAAGAEALTHYLVSLQPKERTPLGSVSSIVMAEGERLYHQVGCVQCHAPTQLPEKLREDAAARAELTQLQAIAVPLGNLAKKYSLAELTRFLRDPVKIRPSGRMPSLGLTEHEAGAVAMHLLRGQIPEDETKAEPGVRYAKYEGDFPELPEFSHLTPAVTGITPTPSLAVAPDEVKVGMRFEGRITVPKAGAYTFYLESDDGSVLMLDGKRLIDNGGRHAVQERTATVDLTAGAHAFRLDYFQADGETVLNLRWSGPGIPRQLIPRSVFSHLSQPLVPVGQAAFSIDPEKVERGRALFAELNCASCHQLDTPGRSAKPFPQLVARQPRGCLSAKPAPNVPRFEINDRQRQVILALLQSQAPLQTPLTDEEQIRRTMMTLNCYACHQRDRRGGSDGLRREYFTTLGEVDLGDEGRIPPSLQKVGAKLQPKWMKEVLLTGAKARPYMATRMPQFGEANVSALPELFVRADVTDPETRPVIEGLPEADIPKYGRKLTGAGGLNCVSCHRFGKYDALGVPAIDLTLSSQRLRWDWFRRYLLDPHSLRPGTRMPAFWPKGVAANQEVLGGDPDKQIASIWLYLAQPDKLPPPLGLLQGKQELLASAEPVIYRNFIEGGGSRAIGVGYPEKVNLCFDANELRLALIWQGAFIDASRHRTGRGIGYEKPLGTNVVKRSPALSFARLESESSPWPRVGERPHGARFRGYRLDAQRRPTFSYTVAGVDIDDTPLPVPGELEVGLRRTITLRAEQPPADLYYRAALGARIEERDGGTFVVDDRLRLRFPKAKPRLRRADGRTELLVPIEFADGKATLTEEIAW